MSTDTQSPIPEKYLEFCRAVATLAAEKGLDYFTLNFRPGYRDRYGAAENGWSEDITASWTQGRHGEDSRKVIVTSTVLVRAEA